MPSGIPFPWLRSRLFLHIVVNILAFYLKQATSRSERENACTTCCEVDELVEQFTFTSTLKLLALGDSITSGGGPITYVMDAEDRASEAKSWLESLDTTNSSSISIQAVLWEKGGGGHPLIACRLPAFLLTSLDYLLQTRCSWLFPST
mmetsp:Transcript_42843/g.114656  ORF Transcript_42843/g.114656 Transcript_42843/m.114656 type:complete len:148 (+) Transcript_42843:23-466(+)